jgi:hypothetical protein
MYVSAARSLARTGGLTVFTGEPLSIFPPGFPVILGGLSLAGIDVQMAAVVFNLLCVGATVLLTFALTREALESSHWGLVGAAVVSVAPATFRVFSMIWSEPVFVVLTLLSLWIGVRMVRRGALSWWSVGILGVVVSAATTIRFVGFTLIPVAGLAVFLAARRQQRVTVRSVLAGVLTAALASAGLLAVGFRNVHLGYPPLGERYASSLSIMTVLRRTLVALGWYVVPSGLGAAVATIAGVVLVGLLGCGLGLALRARNGGLFVIGGFVGLYWMSLWYGQLSTQIDPVNERLMSPAFTPMIILVLFGIQQAIRNSARSGAAVGNGLRAARVLVMGFAVLWLIVSFAFGVRDCAVAAAQGRGFNSDRFLSSPLAAAVAQLPRAAGIASNNAALAYWLTDREPVVPVPTRGHYSAQSQTDDDARQLFELTQIGAVSYLAYFEATPNALTPAELADYGVRLRLAAKFDDGTLWQVRTDN